MQTRSKLLVRENEVVATQALALMQHEVGVRAPAGPPSLTHQAWIDTAAGAQVSQPALTQESQS